MKAVSILERTPNFRRCVKLKFIKSVKISWETARAVTDHRDHLSPENNLSRLKLRAINDKTVHRYYIRLSCLHSEARGLQIRHPYIKIIGFTRKISSIYIFTESKSVLFLVNQSNIIIVTYDCL